MSALLTETAGAVTRGRVAESAYDEPTAHVAAAQLVAEYVTAAADLERAERERRTHGATFREVAHAYLRWLEEAVEDDLIPVNHARSKRLKVDVPKPKRTFLEMDELACVEDAAAEQDPSLERFALGAREARPGSTAAAVALGLAEGKCQQRIAAELRLAPGAVHFHVRNLSALRVGVYVGRKAISAPWGAQACATASYRASASASSGCTTPKTHASVSPPPRPKRA